MHQQTPVSTTKKREYARYTLLIYYTYKGRNAVGRDKQTFRDDITTLQYMNKGMKVEGLHPLHILSMKILELKGIMHSAYLYDNYRQKQQQIHKLVIDKGKEIPFGDLRGEYYDLNTGAPIPSPINDLPKPL